MTQKINFSTIAPMYTGQNTTPDLHSILGHQLSKGMLKKLEIVLAAIDCIATIGFEKTTYEAIAKKLNTRRAHIAYHFKNKQDILESCIKYIVSNYHSISLEHQNKATSGKDRLMRYIEGPYVWSQQYPNQLSTILLFYYLCSVHDHYKELHDDIRRAGQEKIAEILEMHLKLNASKSEIKSLSRSIQNIMNGSHLSLETSNISTLRSSKTHTKKLVWSIVTPYLP